MPNIIPVCSEFYEILHAVNYKALIIVAYAWNLRRRIQLTRHHTTLYITIRSHKSLVHY